MSEVNGLKTAVKHGKISADEALTELQKRAKKSGYLSEHLVKWLRNRKQL